MTANTRSIDIKGVVSNKTRIKSKFFASTPSSEDESSDENTTTLLATQEKKGEKGFPQTPGSLDTFSLNDEALVFKKDGELDG
jgi:hypothetical protein